MTLAQAYYGCSSTIHANLNYNLLHYNTQLHGKDCIVEETVSSMTYGLFSALIGFTKKCKIHEKTTKVKTFQMQVDGG